MQIGEMLHICWNDLKNFLKNKFLQTMSAMHYINECFFQSNIL
jgi:hypothetical protein